MGSARTFIYTAGDEKSHIDLGKKLREILPEWKNNEKRDYVVVVKVNRPIRSIKQNAYYWVCLQIVAIETGHTKEQLHEICKKRFNSDMIPLPKSGNEIVPNTTSDLDELEFIAYTNRCKQFFTDEFGIVIPEREKMTEAQRIEIENTYFDNFIG